MEHFEVSGFLERIAQQVSQANLGHFEDFKVRKSIEQVDGYEPQLALDKGQTQWCAVQVVRVTVKFQGLCAWREVSVLDFAKSKFFRQRSEGRFVCALTAVVRGCTHTRHQAQHRQDQHDKSGRAKRCRKLKEKF